MNKILKRIGLVLSTIVALLALSFAYGIYGFATARERMDKVCAQIPVGMSIDELRKFSADNGLLNPHLENGTDYLGEGRTMGRHSCKVEMKAGKVVSSVRNFMD